VLPENNVGRQEMTFDRLKKFEILLKSVDIIKIIICSNRTEVFIFISHIGHLLSRHPSCVRPIN
jgi:hypothetical protein